MSTACILIVEDEAILAADLRHIIERMGHTCSGTAASCEAALRQIAESPPDIVLMDINIQGPLDGIETAHLMRKAGAELPVIFLTSYLDSETVLRAREDEPFGYLLKPYDEVLIGITIEMALHRHKAEMERARMRRELERTQGELERSNESLAHFAYVASHDLQEPLRVIVSYLQIIQRRYKGKLDDQGDQYISYAADGAARLQTLIRDLLAFSKATTKGANHVLVDMQESVARAMEYLKIAIAEKRAEILCDPLPVLPGNLPLLAQLLQNLLSNAIKFCDDEVPRVRISAHQEGEEWIFSVKDNGIGIEPQYRDQIFVIFKRLHSREHYPGTGIGLALCKRIVEHHGGRIWVESEPGNGASFHFTLPTQPQLILNIRP